ncbi:MAG: TRAP transporter large permease subunit [Deltaproteobacteria bacterium]|nr:TRAP transporter large permease subunit [Deltaproteobacteria bacterium]
MTLVVSFLLILMVLIGAPLYTVLAGAALYCFYITEIPLMVVINEMYRLTDQEIFITLPLFTFAGVMMSRTHMPERLLDFSRALLGWLPGGMAIVALLMCALVTAFTGVTGVTIVAVGVLLYPALVRNGYSNLFNLGLLTSSGSFGLLIPPAVPLILFAIIAKIGPANLFLAGALPMLLMIVLLCLYSIREGIKLKMPRNRPSLKTLGQATWRFKWELPVLLVIPLGIFGGYLTAIEAASVMAFYVLVVEVLILREISFKDFPKVTKESMVLIGGILVIIMASLATSNFFIQEEVPTRLFNFLHHYIHTRIGFLLLLNVFLLILGCLLDIFSSIVIVVPLLLPIAEMYGINLYHLGIIFLANMQIGYSTPPLGMNLFIASHCFKEPVVRLFRATLPFLAILLVALMIITYWSDLSLYLLKLTGKI